MPQARMISPTARIRPKIKVERLFTTVSGSSSAKAVTAKVNKLIRFIVFKICEQVHFLCFFDYFFRIVWHFNLLKRKKPTDFQAKTNRLMTYFYLILFYDLFKIVKFRIVFFCKRNNFFVKSIFRKQSIIYICSFFKRCKFCKCIKIFAI